MKKRQLTKADIWIVFCKGICGGVSINTLDRYSIDTPSATRLTLHRHLCWQLLTNFRLTPLSRSTPGRLLTNHWWSVHLESTEYPSLCQSRCWLRVLMEGIEWHWTADTFSGLVILASFHQSLMLHARKISRISTYPIEVCSTWLSKLFSTFTYDIVLLALFVFFF